MQERTDALSNGVLYLGNGRMLDEESVYQLTAAEPNRPYLVRLDDEGNVRLIAAWIQTGRSSAEFDVTARKVEITDGIQIVAVGKGPPGREAELVSKIVNAVREAGKARTAASGAPAV